MRNLLFAAAGWITIQKPMPQAFDPELRRALADRLRFLSRSWHL